jgi:hypothetical protein
MLSCSCAYASAFAVKRARVALGAALVLLVLVGELFLYEGIATALVAPTHNTCSPRSICMCAPERSVVFFRGRFGDVRLREFEASHGTNAHIC